MQITGNEIASYSRGREKQKETNKHTHKKQKQKHKKCYGISRPPVRYTRKLLSEPNLFIYNN